MHLHECLCRYMHVCVCDRETAQVYIAWMCERKTACMWCLYVFSCMYQILFFYPCVFDKAVGNVVIITKMKKKDEKKKIRLAHTASKMSLRLSLNTKSTFLALFVSYHSYMHYSRLCIKRHHTVHCQGPLFGRGILSFTNWNKQKHTMSNLLQSEHVHIKGQMYLTSKYQWNCFCSLTPVLHTHTNTHTHTHTQTKHTHTQSQKSYSLKFDITYHLA